MKKIAKFFARLKLRRWQKKELERQNSPKRKKGKKKLPLKKIVKILGFLCLGFLALLLVLFIYFAKDLPDPQKIGERKMLESTKIYDRTGEILLYEIHGDEKRTVVPLENVSLNLTNATLATEDANFYHHFGLDFKGLLRGAFLSLTGNSLQSGSTITQQFVKQSILSSEQTFSRKIKEIILSIELEMRYSKHDILELYLNQIPYGSNIYGAEAAAQGFFGKSAKDLTIAEAAVLASLPKAPTYYSPYGSHPEKLQARKEYVIDRMVKLNMITPEQGDEAKKQELAFSANLSGIKAPHFVMFVKEYLEEKYGQDYLEQSGLSVYTTLDWDLQQVAEKTIIEGAAKNEKRFGAHNAALVSLDPKTGQVLAMVGSKDYFDLKNDGNVNVTVRPRQPGSSFKPFAYATAFKKGFSPDTILFDVPTNFSDDPANPYAPQNYSGTFSGPVSMRNALARSLNIPAVKTLYLAGLTDTLKQAAAMGISTLDNPDRFGLALVLGGGEVKLLDEASAYGVFATEGTRNNPASILKIIDRQGKTVEEFRQNPNQVLDRQVARQINSVLSDNAARAPVFGSSSYLSLGNITAAVKTGTTNEYRDAWTVGYTPSIVAGVWVGNNNNSKMNKADGSTAAAPIWNAFMKGAYSLKREQKEEDKKKDNYFNLPQNDEGFASPQESSLSNKPMLNGNFLEEKTIDIDSSTGEPATANTPLELIQQKIFRQVHCILYYVNKNEPQGDIPKNPADDPQFNNWEAGVVAWAQSAGIYNEQPPAESGSAPIDSSLRPTLTIISPTDNEKINKNVLRAEFSIVSPAPLKQIDFFIDDSLVASRQNFVTTLDISLQGLKRGVHTFKIKAYDKNLKNDQASVDFVYNLDSG